VVALRGLDPARIPVMDDASQGVARQPTGRS
jgi:hypothetical protein